MSDFHEPVNIGNPREMTIKQFAEEIIRITGAKSTIEYKPLAGGRSEGAPAGYCPREKNPRLGTKSRVRRRNQEDDRIF